jgi:hypothetical protein
VPIGTGAVNTVILPPPNPLSTVGVMGLGVDTSTGQLYGGSFSEIDTFVSIDPATGAFTTVVGIDRARQDVHLTACADLTHP